MTNDKYLKDSRGIGSANMINVATKCGDYRFIESIPN